MVNSWHIQMNIAPVSGQALMSSDTNSLVLYMSIMNLRVVLLHPTNIYCMESLFTKLESF